ncbi:MAG: class I SAM-dependent methyltransferase [bacterium]|nr:class I SAM-dependent methyltransferase [bacterium]
MFSRFSKSYAKSFRKQGLEKVQQLLREGVLRGTSAMHESKPTPADRPGQSKPQNLEILDIGCGVGGLHLTLLAENAAAHARGIDIADGMLAQARDFARDMDLSARVNYTTGDFVDLADEIPPADITLLDKVVCCYENVEELVRLSTDHTRAIYAVSRPRDIWYMRWVFKTQSWFMKMFRFAFYPCWHNWTHVHDQIVAAGFAPVFQDRTTLWDVAVYRRATATA